MSAPTPPAIHDAEEITIREIILSIIEMARTIWKSRGMLASVIAATTAIALLYSMYVSTYRSEGYFQYAMTPPEYRRLLAYIAAPGRWQNFAKTLTADEQQVMQNMDKLFMDKKQVDKLIGPSWSQAAPTSPIPKADMKNLPDESLKETTYSISGLFIRYNANTPIAAQRGVIALGNFLRDTAILMNYTDSTRIRYSEYLASQKKVEIDIINLKHQLEVMQVKKNDLQKVLRNYPEYPKTDGRQLLSLSESSDRFKSPIAHLVAVEYDIAENNRNLPELLRNQRINKIYLRYTEKVLALLDMHTSGVEFLKALPQIKDTLNLNMNDEIEKLVYNSIAIDDLNIQSQYIEKMKFIAEPVLSQQRSSSRLLMGILGLTLGTFFGCAFILLRYFLRRIIAPATQGVNSTGAV